MGAGDFIRRGANGETAPVFEGRYSQVRREAFGWAKRVLVVECSGWERRNLLGLVVSTECLAPAIEIERELGMPKANKGIG